jgi:hypothetical protein
MAFKVFTNGSTLQASEVNDNLMRQAVSTFSNAAARTAAITAPSEGMLTYLEDVNRYESFNGTSWGSAFGLQQIVPTSIARGASGSASVNAGGAVTFTGTESISLNGVFSSAFDNYRFQLQVSAISANPLLNIRFRDGSGDLSSALYSYRVENGSSLGGAAGITGARTQTLGLITGDTLGEAFAGSYDVVNPNLALKTMMIGVGTVQVGNNMPSANAFNATTQLTGLSILSSSGTITGTIRIYGYRNS